MKLKKTVFSGQKNDYQLPTSLGFLIHGYLFLYYLVLNVMFISVCSSYLFASINFGDFFSSKCTRKLVRIT